MKPARPRFFWIATLAVAVATLVLLREILLPFVAGMALAYLLAPLVDRLERIGFNRAVAALGIIVSSSASSSPRSFSSRLSWARKSRS